MDKSLEVIQLESVELSQKLLVWLNQEAEANEYSNAIVLAAIGSTVARIYADMARETTPGAAADNFVGWMMALTQALQGTLPVEGRTHREQARKETLH